MISSPHQSRILVRHGWVQVFFRVLNGNLGTVDGDSTTNQGGLSLHGTTYNRPITYDELADSVKTELCATTFDFGVAGTIPGSRYLGKVSTAFDRINPQVSLLAGEYMTRFELYFDVNGGVYAS